MVDLAHISDFQSGGDVLGAKHRRHKNCVVKTDPFSRAECGICVRDVVGLDRRGLNIVVFHVLENVIIDVIYIGKI